MGKFKVKLVKKIIQKAEIIIDYDSDDRDDVADEAWSKFNTLNIESDYEYTTEVIKYEV